MLGAKAERSAEPHGGVAGGPSVLRPAEPEEDAPPDLYTSDDEEEEPAPKRFGQCDCGEPVYAVKKSYRNVGKKEKQEELFPQHQKEIAAKRVELYKGIR